MHVTHTRARALHYYCIHKLQKYECDHKWTQFRRARSTGGECVANEYGYAGCRAMIRIRTFYIETYRKKVVSTNAVPSQQHNPNRKPSPGYNVNHRPNRNSNLIWNSEVRWPEMLGYNSITTSLKCTLARVGVCVRACVCRRVHARWRAACRRMQCDLANRRAGRRACPSHFGWLSLMRPTHRAHLGPFSHRHHCNARRTIERFANQRRKSIIDAVVSLRAIPSAWPSPDSISGAVGPPLSVQVATSLSCDGREGPFAYASKITRS